MAHRRCSMRDVMTPRSRAERTEGRSLATRHEMSCAPDPVTRRAALSPRRAALSPRRAAPSPRRAAPSPGGSGAAATALASPDATPLEPTPDSVTGDDARLDTRCPAGLAFPGVFHYVPATRA